MAQIIKAVMSSAAESELGALFINAREAVHTRNTLGEMGHPQPPTPIQTDSSAANEVVNTKVQPKKTKPMDTRFHWLGCRMAHINPCTQSYKLVQVREVRRSPERVC